MAAWKLGTQSAVSGRGGEVTVPAGVFDGKIAKESRKAHYDHYGGYWKQGTSLPVQG